MACEVLFPDTVFGILWVQVDIPENPQSFFVEAFDIMFFHRAYVIFKLHDMKPGDFVEICVECNQHNELSWAPAIVLENDQINDKYVVYAGGKIYTGLHTSVRPVRHGRSNEILDYKGTVQWWTSLGMQLSEITTLTSGYSNYVKALGAVYLPPGYQCGR